MSRPKSKLTKILRGEMRREKKRMTLVERHRLAGETDEQMEARMKRNLGGWLDMVEEDEIERTLVNAMEEAKKKENTDASED